MALEMPSQLVISHGSAAGHDPAVAPSDMTAIMPVNKAPRHVMERVLSVTPLDRSVEPPGVTQSAAVLDAALSEGSLGLTPHKSSRRRAASGPRSRRDLMPVMRSMSGTRTGSRGPTARATSPAELKKLRNFQAATPPADTSVQARLAALEANSAASFAYMLEAGPIIQGLQAAAGQAAAHLGEINDKVDRQALEQAELVKATRREIFSVRDLLGDKLSASEINFSAGAAATIEAKFLQLEGFIAQLQTHFVGLHDRESAVEGVVAQDEATVENAFAYVDGKINQVGEIVKRFEVAGASAVPGLTSQFTVGMRESMQHMHTKLANIDGEVLLAVQEQTVPLAGQVLTL